MFICRIILHGCANLFVSNAVLFLCGFIFVMFHCTLILVFFLSAAESRILSSDVYVETCRHVRYNFNKLES
jgi:hypothetical protein